MTDYLARTAYRDRDVVQEYEERRFGSRWGRYIWRREQEAVGAVVAGVGPVKSVLDIPSGFGRWLPVLERLEPEIVVEADISEEMLEHGKATYNKHWPAIVADAERLPFDDGSFDLVFCHALAKHLPPDKQRAVLAELARVASKQLVVAFSVRAGLPALVLRVRLLLGQRTSNAVTVQWLEGAARDAGLRIAESRSCTSPVGVERAIRFDVL